MKLLEWVLAVELEWLGDAVTTNRVLLLAIFTFSDTGSFHMWRGSPNPDTSGKRRSVVSVASVRES